MTASVVGGTFEHRLSDEACASLRHDARRIVITGAGGWIGRATLDLLVRCLGHDTARERVRCFGSQRRQIELAPHIHFQQLPLELIGELSSCPTLVLHLAFLTKDKVAGMFEEEYRRANRELSLTLRQSLDAIGADRLFLASSGAAAFADDRNASADLRTYGQLKRDDEILFAAWANGAPSRRAVTTRIFNLSGPFINKQGTYALAGFIRDALNGRPISVKATRPVVRSYVAIRELMSVVFGEILAKRGDPVVQFDSGGMPIEIGELARCVSESLGPVAIDRDPISWIRADHYVGDGRRYGDLLATHGVEAVELGDQILETAAFLARQLQSHQ